MSVTTDKNVINQLIVTVETLHIIFLSTNYNKLVE